MTLADLTRSAAGTATGPARPAADLLRTAAGPEPTGPEGAFVLADHPMVRINPTPGRRLAGPALRTALRALHGAEQQRAALAEAAGDELYALIGTAAGKERRRLIALRRAVFNRRDPEPADLPGALPPTAAAWLAAQERSLLARTAIRTGMDTFLAEERTLLAELTGSEPFLLSLALNSPQVLDAVQRYRAVPGRPGTRQRKSERGILQHFARAQVRVSPLSRLTAVGFAAWSEDGPRLDRPPFDRRRAVSVATPDRALLSGLLNGILLPPDGTPSPAAVQRNPMLRRDGGTVRFSHSAGGTRRMLATAVDERLDAVLRLTALGPVSTEVLVAELARRLDVPPAAAREVVDALVRAQALVAAPALDEQSADPLPAAAELLRAGHPRAAELVDELAAALHRVEHENLAGRQAALHRVRAVEQALNELSSCPARSHVNEDYLLPPATVSPDGYRDALADLGRVARFQSLFDRHHEIRALLVRAFTDRFGPGGRADLLDHAEELVGLVRARELDLTRDRAAAWGPADGSLRELLERRRDALAGIARRIRDTTGEETVLDPAWLASFADGLPERFRLRAASYGLLVQPVDGRLVLNACYTGHGQLATRFLGAQAALGGDAPAHVAARLRHLLGADGLRLAEDRGLHRSNINHRMPLLDEVITPDEWTGVSLVHDPATDSLGLLDRDGTPLRVLSTGMKWIELQPAPLTLAVWLYDTGRVAFDPVGQLHAALGGTDATTAYPRLLAGDVVLQRRRWYPGPDLPTAEPADDAEQLLALTAWRAAHGVPEEVVLKTPLGLPSGRSAGDDDVNSRLGRYLKARKLEKPQYVDLASALMVRVLPRFLERRGAGYLEEALPGVRGGVHAFEWALEYDLRPDPEGDPRHGPGGGPGSAAGSGLGGAE